MFEKLKEFDWERIGDIEEGRKKLGSSMPVALYRLMQYTINDVLVSRYGAKECADMMREAGYLAGHAFAKNILNLRAEFDAFASELQEVLKKFLIGILRIEKINPSYSDITLTISEDLDCSGLPVTDETTCIYDEGFITGIFKAYTGNFYVVREIDCWSSGDRVCRFSIKLK